MLGGLRRAARRARPVAPVVALSQAAAVARRVVVATTALVLAVSPASLLLARVEIGQPLLEKVWFAPHPLERAAAVAVFITMKTAIEQCLHAAANEFDYEMQRQLLLILGSLFPRA